MTIRVGVIGVGNIGTAHARNLQFAVAGSQVTAVFDANADRAREVAEELDCRVVDSAQAVIDADDVDAIVIASPDNLHATQALACIAAGKATLCEKPLAPSEADALLVLEAEVASGARLLTLGFMRRFDPGYLGLKAEIAAGTVGTPLMVHNVHRNTRPYPGHTTAAAITNSVVHEIDIMRWLLEEEIVSAMCISGRATPAVDEGVRDPQLIIFRTAADAIVDVESFVSARYGYEVSCQVVGTEGTLSMGDGSFISTTQPGFTGRRVPELWLGRFGEAYRAEMQAWIDSVRSGIPCGASTYDGYAATVIANAAVLAGEERREIAVNLQPRASIYL